MREPLHCLPRAYGQFADALERIEESDGLTQMATAIAMHFQQDVTLDQVLSDLAKISNTIKDRVHDLNPHALVAHLHQYMFEELGFQGNDEEYYDPRNSFLPWVIRTRRGIPITLSLVYKLVAEQIGLLVDGLNVPGHFLVQTQVGDESMIVDPFDGGTMLSLEEAHALVRTVIGPDEAYDETAFQPMTHRQWVARMLANLLHVFSMQGNVDQIGAMSELYDLLKVVHP